MEKSNNLPTLKRTIASAVVVTSDGCVLFGRKDPDGGGVYKDYWHLPGGGVDDGETLRQAMLRELGEEVIGLSLEGAKITQLDQVGHGESEKTVDGVKYWCQMEFNRFMVQLCQSSGELEGKLQPGDDFVEIQWARPEDLASVKQIPGGYELFAEIGLID